MKKLLTPFFFGYLSLKWRRFVRTLLLAYIIPIAIIGLYYGVTVTTLKQPPFKVALFLTFLTPLFSYILKPFVVKEK